MERLHSLLLDNCELILESGFTKPLMCVNVEDIPNVVQTVTLHRVILRSLAELSQFKDGIEALGVGKVMNVHSHLLYDFFVQGKDPLTAGVVHHLNRIGARMYKC